MPSPRPPRRLLPLLNMLWPRAAPPPSRRARRDEYLLNFRTYYRAPPRAPRRVSRRKARRTPLQASRVFVIALYAALALLLAARLAGRPLLRMRAVRFTSQFTPPPAAVSPPRAAPVSAADTGREAEAVRGPPAMRPPQFGDAPYAAAAAPAAGALRALDDALRGAADDELEVPGDDAPAAPAHASIWSRRSRDSVTNALHAFATPRPSDAYTRTCYHSGQTGDALCVHAPFCVRHSAIVYMSETLRCAPYSNKQGKPGTLSMGRCVELEREVEGAGEIEQVEHKPHAWLSGLEKDGKILWFEGDSVFIRMTSRGKSVAHFAERVFLLHHVLQHPERYGMGAVSNVVIAADEEVARKIRYSKSWHHGLLAAVVHPNKLIYSHKTIRELVTSVPTNPGEIRVFVPSGVWDLAKGRLVPCFRRAALSGSVRSQFFLSEDVFPGVVEQEAMSSPSRYRDADVFRTLLFQSLGHEGAPRIKKQILYLHRATTRTFTEAGVEALESKLREVAHENGYMYELLDVSGMTFPQQIEAVSGAGIVVGVHGTQMLNTIFLPAGSSIIEIFPYGYSNKLFEGGSGAGLHYVQHQVLKGEDFPELGKFHGLENCVRVSKECRLWYQSDHRRLDFGLLDAGAVGNLVQEGIAHVGQSL